MSEEKKDMKETAKPAGDAMPKKGGMKGVVVGVVSVLVLGGVALGLYQWNSGGSMTTEERQVAMAKKVGELESASFTARMTLEMGEDLKEEIEGDLQTVGIDGEISRGVLEATGVSSMKADNQNASVDLTLRGENADGEESLSLGLNARMVDKLIYVQLEKLPEALSTAMQDDAGFDLSFLEDQWVEVNLEEVADQLGLPAEELAVLEESELTEEERDMVAAAFVDHTFITLMGDGESDSVEAGSALKYEAELDVAELKAFLEEVKPVFTARDFSEEEYNAMLEDINEEEYNKMLEDTNLETHVWVGKKDNELYKVEMMLTPKKEKDLKDLKSVTLSLELWDHNKDVSVETPEDAMSVQEVLGQLIFAAGGAQAVEGADEEK